MSWGARKEVDKDIPHPVHTSPWEKGQHISDDKEDEGVWKDNKQDLGEQIKKEGKTKKEITCNNNFERVGCAFCHLKNHLTRECRHCFPYEICGYDDHVLFDCMKCIPWNFGPELCAAQVEDQSFFFIEEK